MTEKNNSSSQLWNYLICPSEYENLKRPTCILDTAGGRPGRRTYDEGIARGLEAREFSGVSSQLLY